MTHGTGHTPTRCPTCESEQRWPRPRILNEAATEYVYCSDDFHTPTPEGWCGECGLKLAPGTPPSTWTGHVHSQVSAEVMRGAALLLGVARVWEGAPENVGASVLRDAMAAVGVTEQAAATYARLSTPEQGVEAEQPKENEVPDEKGLLLVAVRVDYPLEVQQRIKAILSVAATYERPPDTTAVVWVKEQRELVAADLDRLAEFVGWDRVNDLNLGSVASDA